MSKVNLSAAHGWNDEEGDEHGAAQHGQVRLYALQHMSSVVLRLVRKGCIVL